MPPVGSRVTLYNLRVTRISHYERKFPDESTQTIWRYGFLSLHSDRFVYSGRHYAFEVGQFVSLRATIKRLEPEFNATRLARLKVLTREFERMML